MTTNLLLYYLPFKPSPLETEKVEDVYFDKVGILLSNSEMTSIIRNFNDFDFLNEKFDELREKEMEGTITAFEKSLMDVVVKKNTRTSKSLPTTRSRKRKWH